MSARFWTVPGLVAGLLAAGLPYLAAKSPDLPLNPKVVCEPQAKETAPENVNGTAEVDPDAGPTGYRVMDASTTTETSQGNRSPMAWDMAFVDSFSSWEGIQRCCQWLADLMTQVMVEQETEKVLGGSSEQESPTMAPAEFTCPYLKQKEMEKNCPPPQTTEMPSLMENLDRLNRAHQLYRQAEHYLQAGQPDQARRCFTEIHQLCPGSTVDGRAMQQLLRLQAAGESLPNSASQEQEAPANDQTKTDAAQEIGPTNLAGFAWELANLWAGRPYAEVDCSQPGRLRTACFVPIGGVMVRVEVDQQGQAFSGSMGLQSVDDLFLAQPIVEEWLKGLADRE